MAEYLDWRYELPDGKTRIQRVNALTDNQLAVLVAVVRYGSNYDAARMLGISDQTVKSYLARVRFKLHANDTAHAAWLAAERVLPALEPWLQEISRRNGIPMDRRKPKFGG